MMPFKRSIFFFFSILLQFLSITFAEISFLQNYCNFDYNANYTSNSVFQKNLDTLPSLLTSDAFFHNFTIGESDDKVNVVALCRGDVKPDVCQSCLVDSSSKLRELCPHEKESIAWSDNCMLRYSDRAIFSNLSTLPNAYVYNPIMAKNVIGFNKVLRNLLDNLSVEASQGDSLLKFATGNMSVGSNDVMIYGLVQCTPDLNPNQCRVCLNSSFVFLPKCCNGRTGGRVLMPSCNFRYEIGSFYNEPEAVVTPSPQPVGSTPPANALGPSLSQPSNGKGGKNNASLSTLSAIFAAAVIATF